jgi:hypothetical protein
MELFKVLLVFLITISLYLSFSYYYVNYVLKEDFLVGGNQPLNPLWWIKIGNTAINRTLKAGCWINDKVGKGIKKVDLMY